MTTSMVTGATAGIGLSFAQQLAARGDDLVLVARDEARLGTVATDLRSRHGIAVEVLRADLTDRAQLTTVATRVASVERPIDLLVNNAGFGLKGRFLDNSIEAEQEMLDVLVVAVLRLSHAALGAMTERGSGGVINVSSVAAFLPRGTYSAAKAWVNSFSEWAAYEYRDQGVTITALCPGFTRTEFHERMGVTRGSAPESLWLDVDDLVREALADHARAKVFSVPSLRYKAIVAGATYIPTRVLGKLQSLGRK